VPLCHVTDLIDLPFRAERAVSPLDGSELWVVLDPGFVIHREASDFLRALHGASRSPHTIRAYAGRVASFLGWCVRCRGIRPVPHGACPGAEGAGADAVP